MECLLNLVTALVYSNLPASCRPTCVVYLGPIYWIMIRPCHNEEYSPAIGTANIPKPINACIHTCLQECMCLSSGCLSFHRTFNLSIDSYIDLSVNPLNCLFELMMYVINIWEIQAAWWNQIMKLFGRKHMGMSLWYTKIHSGISLTMYFI